METKTDDNNEAQRRVRRRQRQGNFWTGILFQRIFIGSLVQLMIYINKVYEDVDTTKTYYENSSINYTLISSMSLITPPLIYAIYLSFQEMITNPNFKIKQTLTLFINGLLLIPWQIKRHLDSLYFSSQKICSCYQEDNVQDKETIASLKRNADILEFFENFYAGFLQIILQIYVFFVSFNVVPTTFFNRQILASVMSIISMLIAIRRRDDGLLTSILSLIGWSTMFASRIAIFALVTTILRAWIVLFFTLHALIFTVWIYGIAIDSYYNVDEPEDEPSRRRPIKRLQIWILTFLFFGIPSLVMWPIMFQLKEKNRPMIFLNTIAVENTILLLFWYFYKGTLTDTEQLSIKIIVVLCAVSFIFLALYICCKPKLTDQVVLHDMIYTDTESFGLYYEFCDIVFKLDVKKQFREELQNIRTEN